MAINMFHKCLVCMLVLRVLSDNSLYPCPYHTQTGLDLNYLTSYRLGKSGLDLKETSPTTARKEEHYSLIAQTIKSLIFERKVPYG